MKICPTVFSLNLSIHIFGLLTGIFNTKDLNKNLQTLIFKWQDLIISQQNSLVVITYSLLMKARQAQSLANWVHLMSDGEETFNIFLTLSFADLHIDELHRLLPGSEEYLDKIVVKNLKQIPAGEDPDSYIESSKDFKLRSEAISKNGDVASFFFDKKLRLLLDRVLIKCLGVVDYIIR